MELDKKCVLTINSGSSSIKFALYKIEEPLTQLFYGKMESIGIKNTKLSFSKTGANQKNSVDVTVLGHAAAANFLIDWLEKQDDFGAVKAIGHRIVYGMKQRHARNY
ncbi:acetate and butyrate kinase [Haliscomenobacter hydrossis]|uniref:Acetate and butyrate kinase n=1 Tax=Haliscomenobacter hydrossis (strain ATCC 27775 / DSM 1100 / LMG 10767 / O) TaxID=760192 RepID=F4L2Z7_HALH1|nr:acetate and butyrate kinase [Haliscomenobacter hydrossis]AEE49677.1 acetate and butyrate kinase [Haliscomenobacter hydrossis DSM 1100]